MPLQRQLEPACPQCRVALSDIDIDNPQCGKGVCPGVRRKLLAMSAEERRPYLERSAEILTEAEILKHNEGEPEDRTLRQQVVVALSDLRICAEELHRIGHGGEARMIEQAVGVLADWATATGIDPTATEDTERCVWVACKADLRYPWRTSCGFNTEQKDGGFCPMCGLPIQVQESDDD